jgi:hypothetical protein
MPNAANAPSNQSGPPTPPANAQAGATAAPKPSAN